MKEFTSSVLIVGSGPAGSMAAKTLAENDVNVIMIERNKHIGQPVRCAEGINKFLFQDTGIKKSYRFIENEIRGSKIYYYNELYDFRSEQWQGYTINRKIFDPYLAKLAESAGAEILTRHKAVGMVKKGKKWNVKVKTKDNEIKNFETKIVIGADGFECYVGKWSGLRPKWKKNEYCKCLSLELECPSIVDKNFFHIAFGEEFKQGYAWIFPKRKTANVGVGVSPILNAKNALNFFISDYPKINGILGKNYLIKEKRGGFIPITGPGKRNQLISNGVLLVGDAAGMVDPITGEGICPSMLSGISAGETIVAALYKKKWDKKTLGIYQNIWQKKKYMDTTLGNNFNSLLEMKKMMKKVFSKNPQSKVLRQEFMSLISNLS